MSEFEERLKRHRFKREEHEKPNRAPRGKRTAPRTGAPSWGREESVNVGSGFTTVWVATTGTES